MRREIRNIHRYLVTSGRAVWLGDAFERRPGIFDVDDARLEDFTAVSSDPQAVYDTGGNELYRIQKGVLERLKFPD